MPPGSPDAGLVPAQGYNQEKVSVSVVWSFLFVSEKLPRRLWDPDSSTRRTGGLRRRRGQGWRRWAVPGAAQGRQADKAPPVPPPRPRSKREGSEGQRGGMEREVGEGEEDRRRALPAGLGWSAQKREGREEGPRRAGRREGFLKPKINKLFLFTCGVGGGGRAPRPPLPHAGSLSPPERPATLAPPLALRDPERARCTESTRRGRPAPGSTQPTEGRWRKEGALHGDGYYRGLEPGDTFPKLPALPLPPHPPF